MSPETINKGTASRKATRRHHLLSFFIALVFAVTIYPAKAHAQIIGNLEVTIPFQFHAGNAKLPAGTYIVHVLDNSDLTIMEISSVDGSTSALFQVQDAEANSTPPKSELIFNKNGNRYFLAKVFDEGNASVSEVAQVDLRKEGQSGDRGTQAHIPAHPKAQQGN